MGNTNQEDMIKAISLIINRGLDDRTQIGYFHPGKVTFRIDGDHYELNWIRRVNEERFTLTTSKQESLFTELNEKGPARQDSIYQLTREDYMRIHELVYKKYMEIYSD